MYKIINVSSSSSTATIIQNINSQYKTLNCKVICDTSSISTASKYIKIKGQIDSKNYVNIFKCNGDRTQYTRYMLLLMNLPTAYSFFRSFAMSATLPLLHITQKIKLFLLIFFRYHLVLLWLACLIQFYYSEERQIWNKRTKARRDIRKKSDCCCYCLHNAIFLGHNFKGMNYVK